MRNYFFAIIIVLATVIACGKDDITPTGGDETNNPPQANLPVENKLDVAYGTNQLQKMDIYLPANRTTATTKVIFLIHGGAWMSGDKRDADFAPVVDSIRKRLPDWAVINVNYRLYNIIANRFPAQEEDVKKAIEYVYANRNNYAISDKWVYTGASAGGHLALLQGYKYTTPIKPLAIVNYFGPSDLPKLIAEETDSDLKFGMPILFAGTETASSPVTYITSQSAPTITLQGVGDATVPKSQQEALHAKLRAANVPEQLHIYTDEGHGFTAATMTKSFNSVIAFLNTHVK